MLLVGTLLAAEAAGPSWWSSRSVVTPGLENDDFAVANQGQLKHIAHAAYLEMGDQFSDRNGAGEELDTLFGQLLNSQAGADDFAVVNIGQVKAMALPFYERLQELGLITTLPSWLSAASSAEEEFAAANVGQVKNAFNFEISLAVSEDPEGDFDGDGLGNEFELELGLNPYRKDSDGDGIEDGFEDHDQDGIPNHLDPSLDSPPELSVFIHRPMPGESL